MKEPPMLVKFSFERLKSFPHIPHDELFQKCEQALLENDLEITRSEPWLGILQARKKDTSSPGSDQIFITVRRDSKVSAIEKSAMTASIIEEGLSTDEMITARFFRILKSLV